MKVRELIEELQKLDPELIVIKQKDDEGNGYHKLYVVDDDCYTLDIDEYHLEIHSSEDVKYLIEEGEVENEDCFVRVCVIV